MGMRRKLRSMKFSAYHMSRTMDHPDLHLRTKKHAISHVCKSCISVISVLATRCLFVSRTARFRPATALTVRSRFACSLSCSVPLDNRSVNNAACGIIPDNTCPATALFTSYKQILTRLRLFFKMQLDAIDIQDELTQADINSKRRTQIHAGCCFLSEPN